MIELECACDGGKDSLSMAAAAGGETVMAPGNLVVSAYVGCPDITKVVTPDLKLAAAGGVLLHVDLASVPGARRLGGSSLAQAYDQVGFVLQAAGIAVCPIIGLFVARIMLSLLHSFYGFNCFVWPAVCFGADRQ
jgi:hypothetical protein